MRIAFRALFLSFSVFYLAVAASGATFVVNTTNDTANATPSDGVFFGTSKTELPISAYAPMICIFEMTGHVGEGGPSGSYALEGVHVEFSGFQCPYGEAYTDSGGDFTISVFTDGSLPFTFTKDGYQTEVILVDTDHPEIPINVDLYPQ